jgi:hypothetical protein
MTVISVACWALLNVNSLSQLSQNVGTAVSSVMKQSKTEETVSVEQTPKELAFNQLLGGGLELKFL